MVRVTPKRVIRALNTGKVGTFKPRLRGFPKRLLSLLGKESTELHQRAQNRHNLFYEEMNRSAHELFTHLNALRKNNHFFPFQAQSFDINPVKSELYLALKAHGAKDPEKALPYAKKLLSQNTANKNKTKESLREERFLKAFIDSSQQYVQNEREMGKRLIEKEKVQRAKEKYLQFRSSNAFLAYRLVRAMARHRKVHQRDGKVIEGRLWKRLPGFALAFTKRYLTKLSALESEIDVISSQLERDRVTFEKIKNLNSTTEDIDRRIKLNEKIIESESHLDQLRKDFEKVADEFNQKYPKRYAWSKDVQAAIEESKN